MLKQLLGRSVERVKQRYSTWSLSHVVFEFGAVTVLTWAANKVWTLSLLDWFVVGGSLFCMFVGAMGLRDKWASEEKEYASRATNQRLEIVARNIRRLATTIPTFAPSIAETAVEIVLDHSAIRGRSAERNWKNETKAGLSAMVRPEIVARYHECLKESAAEFAAHEFLVNLADNLTVDQLSY
jgi:hypothetical protein